MYIKKKDRVKMGSCLKIKMMILIRGDCCLKQRRHEDKEPTKGTIVLLYLTSRKSFIQMINKTVSYTYRVH